ncbi:MAG: nicotinate-nucleotide--dimethylbenzimidazole phosphoribosyltransferase [Alphaproteobacteria bacterium]|nr:nicotinate-nucleotide--dimethylbenzimidazole phosphoribosyltransferase [Alphaproteobacteria bacterium]
MSSPVATFAEIRRLVRDLPGPDLASRTKAVAREATLTKPQGALGRLEALAEWMAAWQGNHPPQLRRPRIAVFAGNHGVAARGVSAYPADVTAQMVRNFIAGGAAVNQICRSVDADLRVYEMSLETPTADFTAAPAMSEEECARAMAYGMMAVEQGVDLLALGEMGIANTTAGAALCLALFGGAAADWTGPGTGVDGDALARKRDTVAVAVARHAAEAGGDGLEILRRLGGFELAAIAGAVIAARLARVPVLLDGFTATAAAATLTRLDARLLDHCEIGHLSAEPAHARLCERLGRRPLLDLGMRLGEASGAALAIALVRAAVECHTGMASFAKAGVSGPSG